MMFIFLLAFFLSVGRVDGQCTPYPQDPDRCFLMVGSSVTWEQARAHCFDLGGDLATVDDMGVFGFITTLQLGWPFWVGLRRAANYSDDTWVTGARFDKGVYMPSVLFINRPEDAGQYCTRLWMLAIDDYYCTVTSRFACEFRTRKTQGIFQRVSVGETLHNVEEYGNTPTARKKFECATYCVRRFWCYAFHFEATVCKLYRVKIGQHKNAPASGQLFFKIG